MLNKNLLLIPLCMMLSFCAYAEKHYTMAELRVLWWANALPIATGEIYLDLEPMLFEDCLNYGGNYEFQLNVVDSHEYSLLKRWHTYGIVYIYCVSKVRV